MDFPTLSIKPSYPLEEETQYKTLKSPFEDGYVLSRPQWTKPKRQWKLKYEYLPESDYNTLRDFFENSAKGGAISFLWTHPVTSVTYNVRFKDDVMKAEYVFYKHYNTEFIIEEV